ncbi:GGDEF domain-containing protein [Thermodesulfovibrio hydrogeniphilus]
MLINELEKIDFKCELERNLFDVYVGQISLNIEPLRDDAKIMDAFLRFMREENLSLIPIVDKKSNVVGQIQRNRFLEHTILGRYGYGIHLNSRKSLFEVMETPTTIVENTISLEDASMLVQKRENKKIYDDIIVTKESKYYGVLPVNILLEAITKRAIILAKDSNPLTGLLGNWAIQREIEKRIRCGCIFDVCYIDLNNFKPFNDCYGFEKGDKAISAIGEILRKISYETDNQIFVGHIGGDDFIVITPSHMGEVVCSEIIKRFEEFLPALHGEDFVKGYYTSKNRKGEEMVFPLLSLTCAIVNSANISSFAHLASVASEVKAEAKRLSRIKGSSVIFKDRRNEGE